MLALKGTNVQLGKKEREREEDVLDNIVIKIHNTQ